MQRLLMPMCQSLLVLSLAAACGPRPNIHSTYGMMYREHFAHQMSPHPSRPLRAVTGEEARRMRNIFNESTGTLPGAQGGPQQNAIKSTLSF